MTDSGSTPDPDPLAEDSPFEQPPPGELPPLDLAPMRPLDGEPPDPRDRRWVYQFEVPGERVVIHVHGALSASGLLPAVRIVNGEGRDLSGLFPEVDGLAELPDVGPFTLDGLLTTSEPVEIAMRLAATDPEDAAIRAQASPVHLVIRDLVHLDGRRVGDQPYAARRYLLTSRIPPGPNWSIPEDRLDPSSAFADGAHVRYPVPHLLCRRLDGRYFPGLAGRAWIRTGYPILRWAPVVGWLDDRPGKRHHVDGIMIAGIPTEDGRRRVQIVRAGLTSAIRDQLGESLAQLPVRGTPEGFAFVRPEAPADTVYRWAHPGVSAQVLGMSITTDRLLGRPVVVDTATTE